jgi:hypothetical protein
MRNFPEPEVVSCYFDDAFVPHLAAMHLRWPDEGGNDTVLWHFPGNVRVISPLPDRLGLRIHRTGTDAYEIYLRWNSMSLHWQDTPRSQLVRSSIGPVLAALGTDLEHLLEQPLPGEPQRLAHVA